MGEHENEVQMLKLGKQWLIGVSLKSVAEIVGMKTTLGIFELYIEKYHFIHKGIGKTGENIDSIKGGGKNSVFQFSHVPFMEKTAHFNCKERNLCFITPCHTLICI